MPDALPNDLSKGDEFPRIDDLGNPMVKIQGCPNCGKRQDGDPEWMDVISYSGARNVGRDPNGYCSRRCQLQHEYAGQLAARDGAL